MICEISKCTSCCACYNACPKHCITMDYDEFGFVHPKIHENECIKCNLCRNVCPAINKVEAAIPKTSYAAWALEASERNTSTSGGAAAVFSNYILENGGVVFGASMEDRAVKHIKITEKKDLYRLKGSKYVHSRIGDTYKEAKDELISGRKVLFIGTPCQIAGLKNYLRISYDELITADIICHGVPSEKMLKDYIKESLNIEDYDGISFRDSSGFNLKLLKGDKIISNLPMKESLYYLGFMKALFYNEACYECLYAKKKRISDVTLGDFWGLGAKEPFKHNTSAGVSVILLNTEKGELLLKACKDKMFLEERSIDEAVNGNSQLRAPSVKHKNHNLFKELYVKEGFSRAAQKSLQFDIGMNKFKAVLKKNKLFFTLAKSLRSRSR